MKHTHVPRNIIFPAISTNSQRKTNIRQCLFVDVGDVCSAIDTELVGNRINMEGKSILVCKRRVIKSDRFSRIEVNDFGVYNVLVNFVSVKLKLDQRNSCTSLNLQLEFDVIKGCVLMPFFTRKCVEIRIKPDLLIC